MNKAPHHIATKILIAIGGALALGLTLLLPLMAASQPAPANSQEESRQPDIGEQALARHTAPAAKLPALRPPATALSVLKLVATDSAPDGAIAQPLALSGLGHEFDGFVHRDASVSPKPGRRYFHLPGPAAQEWQLRGRNRLRLQV